MQTLKQIEKETQRRVKEDGSPRVVYMIDGALLKIGLLEDVEDRPVLDQAVSIVWPDRIEII